MLAVSESLGRESARGISFRRCSIFLVSKYALCSVPVILGTTYTLKCKDDPSFVNRLSSVTGVCNCCGFELLNVKTDSVSDPLTSNWSFFAKFSVMYVL